MNIRNLLLISVLSSSTVAVADIRCSFEAFSKNQQLSSCRVVVTVPSNSATASEFTCDANGYVISLNCNLYAKPMKLSLAIQGPKGNGSFTDTRNSLTLIDDNGDGAAITCDSGT